MKLSIKGFALAAGIVCSLAVLLGTLLSLWHSGGHIGLLSHIYLGYTVSYVGSIIGLVYGFVTGVVAGALFAWLYNRL